MSVEFIIGRAGTGKTERSFRAIVDAVKTDPLGPPIYWIVPRQSTFMIQRRLVCDSGLDGFTRARVVTFETLGEEILAEVGGVAIPGIQQSGRQMILGHLLRQLQAQLTFFGASARQAGLAVELDATLSELERAGKTPEDLHRAVDEITADESQSPAQAMLPKLRDLKLIYEQYLKYLGQERLDPHRRLLHVLESVSKSTRVPQCTYYVDDFYDFTEYERRLIAGIAKTGSGVHVSVLGDPSTSPTTPTPLKTADLRLFHRTDRSLALLLKALSNAGVTGVTVTKLEKARRFVDPALSRVEALGFETAGASSSKPAAITSRPPPSPPPSPFRGEAVVFLETFDRSSELHAAATKIRELTRAGVRYRDICILMRSLDDYSDDLPAIFAEHGIPFFMDRRRDASHHPLVRLVRALPQLALHDWPYDATMTVVKSGLCGLRYDEADLIENFVIENRVRGSAWASQNPWTYPGPVVKKESDDDVPDEELPWELQQVNELRRKVVAPIKSFVALLQKTKLVRVRDVAAALVKALQELGVPGTLVQWMKDAEAGERLEERDKHEQVWNETIALLDQMVEVLGDEQVTPEDFATILESGLAGCDLGLTPAVVDQVLVGSIDRSRTGNVAATILLGMNQGVFPRTRADTTILNDEDRGMLSHRAIDLEPDTRRALLDEKFLAYVACTRSSQFLCLTRHMVGDSGRTVEPSVYWTRLRQILPDAPVMTLDAGAQLLTTPRQLVSSLLLWAQKAPHIDSAALPALYQWISTRAVTDDALTYELQHAWPALRSANTAMLSKEVVEMLYMGEFSTSVSRLESFAACPFKHFAGYVLGLKERDSDTVTPLDLGNLYHKVLEGLASELVKSGKNWPDRKREQTHKRIRELADEIGRELRGDLMSASTRGEYLLDHSQQAMRIVTAALETLASHGSFRPAGAEVAFGPDPKRHKLPPLELITPKKRKVLIQGMIDRVDIIEKDLGVLVVDYKSSEKDLRIDHIYHGLSLQLLTYLVMLGEHGMQLCGHELKPAGALYVPIRRGLKGIEHPTDKVEPTETRDKPNGLINVDYLSALDSAYAGQDGFRSQLYDAWITKDGTLKSSLLMQNEEIAILLAFVREQLGRLVDQIADGTIAVEPYYLRRATPCPTCPYHSVCRFDETVNGYRDITPLKRDEVFNLIKGAKHGK